MKYDIVIFVQASADLRHALTIYEKNKGKHLLICVVHVNLIYDFASKLSLVNTDVKFFSYVNINMKNPFSYKKSKNDLKNVWQNNFQALEIKEVYFFSRFYDWFTAGLIGFFLNKKNANVFYYEHYDDASVLNDSKISRFSKNGLKSFIISKILSYVSNVNIGSQYSIRNIEFNYRKYSIQKFIPYTALINDEFLFNINKNNVKTILFLLSPAEINMLQEYSIEKIKNILLELKKQKIRLVLKGHPRLGLPEGFESFFESLVPNYIPSEFINYKNIHVTIGIISSGLNYVVSIPNTRVISIIDFLEFKVSEKKFFYRQYLTELSLNKMHFAEESNFITNVLK